MTEYVINLDEAEDYELTFFDLHPDIPRQYTWYEGRFPTVIGETLPIEEYKGFKIGDTLVDQYGIRTIIVHYFVHHIQEDQVVIINKPNPSTEKNYWYSLEEVGLSKRNPAALTS